MDSRLEYLGHQYILESKSSEWIKIDLPARVWGWETTDPSEAVRFIKRIKDCHGNIIWRLSTGRGEWLTLDPATNSSEIEIAENIWKETQKTFREDKLKRILDK